MKPTRIDRVLGNGFSSTLALLGFVAAIIGFFAYDSSAWLILLTAVALLFVDVCEKRMQAEREWQQAKTPGHFKTHRPSVIQPLHTPVRRSYLHRLMLLLGHPLPAWSILVSSLLLLWRVVTVEYPASVEHGAVLAMFALLPLTAIARDYRRRANKARRDPIPNTARCGDSDGEAIVRHALPPLVPTPSVRQAMEALPPRLYGLILDGLKAEQERRRP